MKTRVVISNGSILNELLSDVAKNDNSSLTIDSYNKIIENSDTLIGSEDLMASVRFIVNDCEIDFNDMIIAFGNLFTEISKRLELDKQQEEINKQIEQGIQNKLDDQYSAIFEEVCTIHQLIEANREKIRETMFNIEDKDTTEDNEQE